MARPSMLNQERFDILISCAGKGVPIAIAAKKAGVRRETVYNWLNQGEEESESEQDTMHARFFNTFTRDTGTWGAAEWERMGAAAQAHEVQRHNQRLLIRFPAINPKNRIELTGNNGGPVQVGISPTEELANLLLGIKSRQ